MNTIKVAIIGFGGIARFHYTAYRKLMAEGFPIRVVAVCDKNTAGLFDEIKINLGGAPPS
jgi:predicted dehydrogenase